MMRSKAQPDPSSDNQTGGLSTRGHGTEGRPSDPGPLGQWDRQCSRHACCEHYCKILLREVPQEMSGGGGEG